MYKHFLKRFFDFILSLTAILLLSPLLLILTGVNAIAMGGNPFFTQERPGRRKKKKNPDGSITYGEEKIFRLVKFRSMNFAKDSEGNLLPDDQRLSKWGKLLRKSSLDELPELFNILLGQMSIVGPRPLLVRYLPRYSEAQRHRHDVRPGLTGWAQVNGRNSLGWQDRFEKDVWYAEHVSFWLDMKILFMTVGKVLKRDGISSATNVTMEEFMGND